MAKEYVDSHPRQAPLITINSWNEWTETSYLQPCNIFGYGYLEAVKEVFCPADNKTLREAASVKPGYLFLLEPLAMPENKYSRLF